MSFELPDLAMLERIAAGASGLPLQLALGDIDEDPEQPRQEFDVQPLEELAATIAAGGVRQPVSVRPHPADPGRWMLNFGTRRLRASRLAGKAEIPAFVDNVFDSYAQVIENEQREPLKPLELALFIERRLAAGESRADIARRLGKSRSYVTFVSALVEAPAFLLELYRSRRCTGLHELYDLRKLHETRAEEVEDWARVQNVVSREDVMRLKTALVSEGAAATLQTPSATAPVAPIAPPREAADGAGVLPIRATRQAGAMRRPAARLVLQALYGEQEVCIDLAVVPAEDGQVWVCDRSGQKRACVAARDLRLLRVCRI
jgi:ParB family transcriptional regulator, chromosome partitioning protein